MYLYICTSFLFCRLFVFFLLSRFCLSFSLVFLFFLFSLVLLILFFLSLSLFLLFVFCSLLFFQTKRERERERRKKSSHNLSSSTNEAKDKLFNQPVGSKVKLGKRKNTLLLSLFSVFLFLRFLHFFLASYLSPLLTILVLNFFLALSFSFFHRVTE